MLKVATPLIYLMRHTWASHLSVMQSSGNATKAASTISPAVVSPPLVVAGLNYFSTSLFLKPSCSFTVRFGTRLFVILFFLYFLLAVVCLSCSLKASLSLLSFCDIHGSLPLVFLFLCLNFLHYYFCCLT